MRTLPTLPKVTTISLLSGCMEVGERGRESREGGARLAGSRLLRLYSGGMESAEVAKRGRMAHPSLWHPLCWHGEHGYCRGEGGRLTGRRGMESAQWREAHGAGRRRSGMRTHRHGQQEGWRTSEVRAEKVEMERISHGAVAYHPSRLPTHPSDGGGRP